MLQNTDYLKRRTGPAGTYKIDQFAKALGPLWVALKLRPGSRHDEARAASIATSLFDGLSGVLSLEDVYDTAALLAEEVERTGQLPDFSDFLPGHRKEAVDRYIASRRPTTREGLRKLGYPVRAPRRPR